MMSQIHLLLTPLFCLNVLHFDLPNLVLCLPMQFIGFFSVILYTCFFLFFLITYMNNESTKYLFTELWQNSTVTMSENKTSVFIFSFETQVDVHMSSVVLEYFFFVFSDGCVFKLDASYKNNVTLRQHQTRIAR